jgi:hypothetical protein
MKRNVLLFVFAAVFCAAGAYAQDQAPSTGSGQPTGAKKAAWESGVKKDCSAEIADGGVCAGKDFSTGLEKCLHKNKAKLSDGCAATVHKHRGGGKGKKGGSDGDSGASTPAPAPAPAPAQ